MRKEGAFKEGEKPKKGAAGDQWEDLGEEKERQTERYRYRYRYTDKIAEKK